MFPAQQDFSTSAEGRLCHARRMLGSMRNERGRPNFPTRLLLYVVAVAVLGPLALAVLHGVGFSIFGYPL